MAPVSREDLQKVSEAAAEGASRRGPSIALWSLVASIAIAAVAGIAWAAVGQARAEEAYQRTGDHEKRITTLEANRAADRALLERVERALEENAKALQAVQLELAKRR